MCHSLPLPNCPQIPLVSTPWNISAKRSPIDKTLKKPPAHLLNLTVELKESAMMGVLIEDEERAMRQRSRLFLVIFLLCGVVSGLVHAETPTPQTSSSGLSSSRATATPRASSNSGYPTRQDPYVNDLANALSSTEEQALRTVVQTISRDFDLTVLIIGGIADYDSREPTIETFSTTLFNQWGVGDAMSNKGVLVVLAMRNREVRIEVGDGYKRDYDDDMKAVIEEYMIPRFKEGNYGRGLTDGVTQIYREIMGTLPGQSAQSGVPTRTASWLDYAQTPRPDSSTTTYTTSSSYSSSYSSYSSSGTNPVPLAVGGVGVLGIGGLGAMFWRRYQRNKPRICPQCQTTMHRLDEAADDTYLDEGQRLEEQLGSVDYDVWECPSCQTRSIFDYASFFSRYSQCPQCSYRTETRHSYVVMQPTEYSTGLRRVEGDCQKCGNHREWTETIPRVQRSHSSSSGGSSHSSGGGGHSSGGGASGSW
jgi:uncharacterized protein